MISKNLLFNLHKEDLKRRIWSLALIILSLVVILPIRCALEVEGYIMDNEWIKKAVINLMGASNTLMVLFTIICAVVCGLSGFFYLHSRKKVDLYHSIPVKRETLFSVSFINGVLIYVIPYLFNVILCFVVLSLKNLMSVEVFQTALIAFGFNILYYCLIYTVTIIAVMLTGNIIISILGAGVFLLYGPMWVQLWELYSSAFFKTYYTRMNFDHAYTLSSPVLTYVGLIVAGISHSRANLYIIISVIMLVILIGLAVFLYKKRPSEAAGNAMTFAITKPIIKFLLVVPIALGGGIILRNIVSGNRDGWFLFGLMFMLIISYGFIQVIYNFDIRSAFKQKKQLLACFIISGIAAGVFRFDMMNIDGYIPKMSEIESMSVYISGVDQQLHDYDSNGHYIEASDYHLKLMELTDFNAAYSLAKVGIDSTDKLEATDYRHEYFIEDYYRYVVKYKLKNGKTEYRKYMIAEDTSRDLLQKIYDNKAFKSVHYPINRIDSNNINELSVSYASDLLNYTESGMDGNGNINFTNKTDSQEIVELTEIYKKELNQLSFEAASNENPIAILNLFVGDTSYSGYYIYPSFTNTLAFLEEHGFDTTKSIDIKKVKEIIVSKNANLVYEMQAGDMMKVADEQLTHLYTSEEQTKQILPVLVNQLYYDNNQTLSTQKNYIQAIVNYSMGDGISQQSFYYRFLPDQIPNFVKTDLNISE